MNKITVHLSDECMAILALSLERLGMGAGDMDRYIEKLIRDDEDEIECAEFMMKANNAHDRVMEIMQNMERK